jgi:hypothetical protein
LYGIIRLTLGAFGGFMASWLSLSFSILRVAYLLHIAAEHVESATGLPDVVQPAVWLTVLGAAAASVMFWDTGLRAAIQSLSLYAVGLCLALALAVALGSPVNALSQSPAIFPVHANSSWQRSRDVLGAVPRGAWLYSGVELVPLIFSLCRQPERVIPTAFLSHTLVMQTLGALLTIALAALPLCGQQQLTWPALLSSRAPLVQMSRAAFGLSPAASAALCVPALVASVHLSTDSL